MRNIRQSICWFALALVNFQLSTGPAAAMRITQLLQPHTSRSPSGVYSILVDPSDRHGIGKASYRLTKNDKQVWQKEFPFALWEAAVTDDGVVGGVAYSRGIEGMRSDGDFQVVIIDGTGDIRLNEVTPRGGSRPIHGWAGPFSRGLCVDGPNDRLVVRVNTYDDSQDGEHWWNYRLSDGKSTGKFQPKKLMADNSNCHYLIDARHVAGTDLVLAHWWMTEGGFAKASKLGGRFSLLDPQGKSVWQLDLPADYNIEKNEEAQDRQMYQIQVNGAILSTNQAGRFEIREVAKGQRVTFAVEKSADKWAVREIERKPYVPIDAKAKKVAFPERQLKSLHSVTLGRKAPKPGVFIRDIVQFAVIGQNRFAFLRRDDTCVTLVVIDQAGKLVQEMPLDRPDIRKFESTPQFAWLGNERFVIVNGTYETGTKASAWFADLKTKQIQPVANFDCPRIEQVDGTREGGFVALATDYGKNTMTTTVFGFDATGKRLWVLPHGYGDGEGVLFSPKAIAVTTAGEVAVLDVIKHIISYFDKSGQYLRTVGLNSAWNRKPNYPSYLAADIEGGTIVGDFNGNPPIVRMNIEGKVVKELTAKFSDDRTESWLQHVQVTPDGRLWTTDRESILRLNDEGVVDLVLGEPPDPKQLKSINQIHIDAKGRVFAVDGRTSSVHVFDRKGHSLFTCVPKPTDFAGPVGCGDIAVAATGDIFLEEMFAKRFLHFKADGQRVGFVQSKADDVSEHWYFRPDGKQWVTTFHDLRLFDNDKLVRTISRSADNKWLHQPGRASVASDGSIAVVTGPMFNRDEAAMLHFFGADGQPIRSIALPSQLSQFDPYSYDGDKVAMISKGKVYLFSSTGSPIASFYPLGHEDPNRYLIPFLSAKEKQLIVFDGRRELLSFELP